MNGKTLIKESIRYLRRRTPTILAIGGAIGVVATAISAAKTAPKVVEILNEAEIDKGEKLTKMEIISVAAPHYIPSILIGAASIACIFSSSALYKNQIASISGAYILLAQSYERFQSKVNELYGEDACNSARGEVVKDIYSESKPVKLRNCSDTETLLFYEEHYGKFFERTAMEVQDAEYNLNRKFATEGEVSLNDFFIFLGFGEHEVCDALGWSQETICDFCRPAWIDFEHQLVKMDDGMECYIINILTPPIMDYDVPF